MPKAWIDPPGTVRDVAPGDPAALYHPDVAALYSATVPEGIVTGATLVDDVWTNPPPPPAPAVTTPRLTKPTPPQFKLLFTAAERIGIRTARAYAGADTALAMRKAVLDDWFEIVDDPRLTEVDLTLPATIAGIGYLAMAGLIAPERAETILSGEPPGA